MKNAQLAKVKDYWPQHAESEHAERQIMVCVSHGDCPERGIKDGHEIRTSLIEQHWITEGKVETLNSIYQIND